jgi:alpha,alpha-trehalose phosphorylase
LDVLAQTESVFALSNGHIGWRGNLDEGEPYGLPGSYLNGVFEIRPLPYAERGYGNPESGQTIINVTNGKVMRLLVNDEPFDVRYGELRSHERCLDFRAGVLGRQAEWVSPAGCGVKVTSTRMVSLTQRSIAAICYEVEPVNQTTRIVVQSELVANEQLPVPGRDPRGTAALLEPLVEQADASRGARAGLVHSTRESALIVAVVMDHVVDGPPGTLVQSESFPALGSDDGVHHFGTRAAAAAHQGRCVWVVRFPVVAGSSRPGRRGVGRCHADRLGGAAGRATRLS